MKSLFLILIAGAASWHYIDLESSFFLTAFLMPTLFGFSVFSLLVWISNRVSSNRVSSANGVYGGVGGYNGMGDGGSSFDGGGE